MCAAQEASSYTPDVDEGLGEGLRAVAQPIAQRDQRVGLLTVDFSVAVLERARVAQFLSLCPPVRDHTHFGLSQTYHFAQSGQVADSLFRHQQAATKVGALRPGHGFVLLRLERLTPSRYLVHTHDLSPSLATVFRVPKEPLGNAASGSKELAGPGLGLFPNATIVPDRTAGTDHPKRRVHHAMISD
jgi:hypothetical protein